MQFVHAPVATVRAGGGTLDISFSIELTLELDLSDNQLTSLPECATLPNWAAQPDSQANLWLADNVLVGPFQSAASPLLPKVRHRPRRPPCPGPHCRRGWTFGATFESLYPSWVG